jgi:hypothetical protein
VSGVSGGVCSVEKVGGRERIPCLPLPLSNCVLKIPKFYKF